MAQKAPNKKEYRYAGKLEVGMLEYQLKEAQGKLEKKQEELNRVSDTLDVTTAVADQRAEKINNYIEVTKTLTARLTRWKMAAIVEAVVFVTYLILQGVG